jgi:hypothetical protein
MYCPDEPAPTPPEAAGGFRILVVSVVDIATGPNLKALFDAI